MSKNKLKLIRSYVTIEINDKRFNIRLNKFDDLVINKVSFGEESSELVIRPSVSNEVRVS